MKNLEAQTVSLRSVISPISDLSSVDVNYDHPNNAVDVANEVSESSEVRIGSFTRLASNDVWLGHAANAVNSSVVIDNDIIMSDVSPSWLYFNDDRQ